MRGRGEGERGEGLNRTEGAKIFGVQGGGRGGGEGLIYLMGQDLGEKKSSIPHSDPIPCEMIQIARNASGVEDMAVEPRSRGVHRNNSVV